jgi:hypothetical protein
MLIKETKRRREKENPLILHSKKPDALLSSPSILTLHKNTLCSNILLSKVQIVVQPLPRLHLLNTQPRLPVSQRSKVQETPHNNSKNTTSSSPHTQQIRLHSSLTNRLVLLHSSLLVLGDGGIARGYVVEVDGVDVEDEFDEGAGYEGGGEVGGEVVVEEELAAHDVEGDVMGGPGEEEETGRVVETVAGA